jgi:hypothetical protein
VFQAINELAQSRFSRHLRPIDTKGLADLSDPDFDVSTYAADELKDRLSRLTAGTIGIAGARGAGKSTLLRMVVSGRLALSEARGERPVGVEVPAPSRYEAREFVPHLFVKLCLAVLGPRLNARRLRQARRQRIVAQIRLGAALYLIVTAYLGIAGLLEAQLAVAIGGFWVALAAVPSFVDSTRPLRASDSLENMAYMNYDRLRYLETVSDEWSSEISSSPARVARRREVSKARQPWTLPEMIDAYREFAGRIGKEHSLPVFVGIDELDKMATGEDAQRFLNEIKALFGQSRAFYLVTLSDDAMSAFESRGLPLRDVFESVFDDVLYVPPLTIVESEAVLHQRVVGMSPPFVALCHVVSGGLPRELIRAAREIVRIAESNENADIGDIGAKLLSERCLAQRRAAEVVASRYISSDGRQPAVDWLRQFSPDADVSDLLARVGVAPVLLDLHACEAEGVHETELLVIEIAAASYRAASTMSFFRDLTEKSYTSALKEVDEEPAAIELLAQATRDLSVTPSLAWATTSRARALIGLEPVAYPLQLNETEPVAHRQGDVSVDGRG